MKKLLCFLTLAALTLSLCTTAFAAGKYVTTIFNEPTKDEAYWDRLFELDREQDPLPEMPEDMAAALKEQFPDPTPEQIAQWSEQAQQRLEEERENNRVDMSLESERRSKMMGLVFGDNIHDIDSPDSSFEGDYQEFPGKDGSTTRVYSDGSVDTKYPDGSWEGMDRNGNRIVEDKDGNRTVSFLNGDTGTVKDGAIEVKQTDGATVTYREDGTFSWTNDSGLVVDYNEYGERTAVGFAGGEKVDLVYGQLPPGDQKITGPNGAFIEWHNGETAELSADGTSVETGDGGYGFTIRGADGSTGQLATDANYNPRIDEQATIAAKQATNGSADTVYTSDEHIEISTMAGGAYDVTINNDHDDQISVTYESPDGYVSVDKQLGGGMYEQSVTSPDGKDGYSITLDENGLNGGVKENGVENKIVETVQNEDGSTSIRMKEGGSLTVRPDGSAALDADDLHIETYPNGEIREYAAGDDYMRFDESGAVTEAHLTGEDGGTLELADGTAALTTKDGETWTVAQNPDGSTTMTLPDGTVRTKDASGEWLKEGEYTDGQGNIYDKDGNLVKGANDAAGFDDPAQWAKPEQPYEDAPAETPPEEPNDEADDADEADEPDDQNGADDEGEGLTARRIAGTYNFSGTTRWTWFNPDPDVPATMVDALDFAAVFTQTGENTLSLNANGESLGEGTYNEAAATFSLVTEDSHFLLFKFREENGGIAATLELTIQDEDGRGSGTYTGRKQ